MTSEYPVSIPGSSGSASIDAVKVTELTVVSVDMLLLGRHDLCGSLWRLRPDGNLENSMTINMLVVSGGIVGHAYIGSRPNEINLNIVGTKVSAGQIIYFPSGNIVMSYAWRNAPWLIPMDNARITSQVE